LEPDDVEIQLRRSGVLGHAIEIVPFEHDDAKAAAKLRPVSKSRGLSLGDRACLALAMTRRLTVLTADRSWTDLAKGIHIEMVR
jgi:PIN domain nuclease of toxin-antitoxin system